MKKQKRPFNPFRSTKTEMIQSHQAKKAAEEEGRYLFNVSHLAFGDTNFMMREELRPVRLQLELLRPEIIQQDIGIESTIVIFGSARVKEPAEAERDYDVAVAAAKENPDDLDLKEKLRVATQLKKNSKYYESARKLARLISEKYRDDLVNVIVTGGGPGIMEAANRGAHDVGANNIGLTITLPKEEKPNPYITPELRFHFHYFAIRKMHFLIRAKALVSFPGGFGTMDELLEALTLLQTKKIQPIPIILVGKEFWTKVINFDALVEACVIDPKDRDLFSYVETPEEALEIIEHFYQEKA